MRFFFLLSSKRVFAGEKILKSWRSCARESECETTYYRVTDFCIILSKEEKSWRSEKKAFIITYERGLLFLVDWILINHLNEKCVCLNNIEKYTSKRRRKKTPANSLLIRHFLSIFISYDISAQLSIAIER